MRREKSCYSSLHTFSLLLLPGEIFFFFSVEINAHRWRFQETRDELSAAGLRQETHIFLLFPTTLLRFLLGGRHREGNPRDFQGKRRFQELSSISDRLEVNVLVLSWLAARVPERSSALAGSSPGRNLLTQLGPEAGARAGRGGEENLDGAHRLAEGTGLSQDSMT